MAHAAKLASSSYWLESGGPGPFPKLDKDIRVDAAVPLKRRSTWRNVNLHLGLGHTF